MRKSDEAKYIETQKQFADVIIKTYSTPNYWLQRSETRLVVELISKQPLYFDVLAKILVYKCDLGVEINYGNESKIIINGLPTEHDIEAAAKELVIYYNDILAIKPKWFGGIKGLIQLLGVIHISYSFKQRVI